MNNLYSSPNKHLSDFYPSIDAFLQLNGLQLIFLCKMSLTLQLIFYIHIGLYKDIDY